MTPRSTPSIHLLPPLLLLAAVLVLWGLGLLGGDRDPSAAKPAESAVHSVAAAESVEPVPPTVEEAQGSPELEAPLRREQAPSQPASTGQFLQVIDPEGEPIEGVEVGWRPHDEQSYLASFDLMNPPGIASIGVTNAAGQVRLPDFEIDAVGMILLSEDWLAVAPATFPLPFAAPPVLLAFPAGSVTGRVVSTDGKPVAGAALGAMVTRNFLFGTDERPEVSQLYGEPANYRYTTSGPDGSFRITGLLETTNRLHVIAPGCEPLSHEFPGPRAGEVRDLGDVVVSPGLEVTFQVLSTTPLEPGTRLYLEPEGAHFCRALTGLPLEADGTLTLHGMRAGDYRWMVERPGAVAVVGELEVKEPGGVIPIEVSGRRTVMVEVVDDAGTPVADFTIEAEMRMGRPRIYHGPGPVEVACGAEEVLRVSAKAEGYAPTRDLRVPPTEDHAVLTLQRYGSLQLEILDPEGLQKLKIGLTQADDSTNQHLIAMGVAPAGLREHAVEEGSVVLDRLRAGRFRVVVDHGGGPIALEVVEIHPGERTHQQAHLPRLHEMEVLVRSAVDGTPIHGVSVRFRGREDSSLFDAISQGLQQQQPVDALSDREGRFTMRMLAEDVRTLRLTHPDFEDASIRVRTEDPQPIVLRLKPRPTIPLQVWITPDRPARHARLSFTRHDPGQRFPQVLGEATLETDGSLALRDIPSGTSRLHAQFRWEDGVQYSFPYGDVDLEDGTPLALTLMPEPGHVSLGTPPLEGVKDIRIQGAEGTEYQSVSVRCTAAPWDRILPLPPGAYRLTASGEGGQRLGLVKVYRGRTSVVDWETETRILEIALTGGSWQEAHFSVRVLDGPHEGTRKHPRLMAGKSPFLVRDLPIGRLEVVFTVWVDAHGRNQAMHWRKNLAAGSDRVAFTFLDNARVNLKVVRPDGTPLPGAIILAHFGPEGEHGSCRAQTGPEGMAMLTLPLDSVSLEVAHPGHRLFKKQWHYSGEESLVLQMQD